MIVVEHNLDVIRTADRVIDLGPEGGTCGGRLVAMRTPEEVARVTESHTGSWLKKLLPQTVADEDEKIAPRRRKRR